MLNRKTMPTITNTMPQAAARLRRERTSATMPTVALALTAAGAVAFISDEISRLEPQAQRDILMQMSSALSQAVNNIG